VSGGNYLKRNAFCIVLVMTLCFQLQHSFAFVQPVFYQWYWSIVTTGVMMVGEINYSDMFFGDNYQHRGENYFQAVNQLLQFGSFLNVFQNSNILGMNVI